MDKPINTARVAQRRVLHFDALEDIQADVDRLAASRALQTFGNWSAAQVLAHLALAMNKSIDGFDYRLPAPVRWLIRWLAKRRLLTRTMPAGYQIPPAARAEMIPEPGAFDAEAEHLRQAIARLRATTARQAHPVLGPLTLEEWEQLHCRHAELHLSFLAPLD